MTDSPSLLRISALNATAQGRLSVVATPIGNLSDWTFRAVDICKAANIIACEDTRVTRKLLQHYGISTRMIAYHEHNAEQQRDYLLQQLDAGQHIALLSDAGTPLISDPGYKLVRDVQEAGHAVETIAGASSVPAALAIAGLPTNRFLFLGFLSSKSSGRVKELQKYSGLDATLVMFESAKRLAAMLKDAAAVLGDARECVVARELTKRHEEVIRGTIGSVGAQIAAEAVRGEIVVVIGPADASDGVPTDEDIETMLIAEMALHPLAKAVKIVAETTGEPRNKIYTMALALKKQQ